MKRIFKVSAVILGVILFLIGYFYLYQSTTMIKRGDLTIELFNMNLFYLYTIFIYSIVPIGLMIMIMIRLINIKKYLLIIAPIVNYVILLFSTSFYELINPIESEWKFYLASPFIIISIIASVAIPAGYFLVYLIKDIYNHVKTRKLKY